MQHGGVVLAWGIGIWSGGGGGGCRLRVREIIPAIYSRNVIYNGNF
jgi:hypothetical protein